MAFSVRHIPCLLALGALLGLGAHWVVEARSEALPPAAVERPAAAPARPAAKPAPAPTRRSGAARRTGAGREGAGKPRRGRTHAIARVRADRSVAYRASPNGRVKGRFRARTRFGSRRALWVMRRRGPWLAVSSELRRDGRPVFVRADHPGIEVARTRMSLHADLSRRRLELRSGRRVLRAMKVGVGQASSRTPPGRYAVTDKLSGRRFDGVYGCCVLALSGRQPDVPEGWPGGDRLAIHGTKVADSIGRATSKGCLRAGNSALRKLMRGVPVGTPVIVKS